MREVRRNRKGKESIDVGCSLLQPAYRVGCISEADIKGSLSLYN